MLVNQINSLFDNLEDEGDKDEEGGENDDEVDAGADDTGDVLPAIKVEVHVGFPLPHTHLYYFLLFRTISYYVLSFLIIFNITY